jgi:hypothetical protein
VEEKKITALKNAPRFGKQGYPVFSKKQFSTAALYSDLVLTSKRQKENPIQS